MGISMTAKSHLMTGTERAANESSCAKPRSTEAPRARRSYASLPALRSGAAAAEEGASVAPSKQPRLRRKGSRSGESRVCTRPSLQVEKLRSVRSGSPRDNRRKATSRYRETPSPQYSARTLSGFVAAGSTGRRKEATPSVDRNSIPDLE